MTDVAADPSAAAEEAEEEPRDEADEEDGLAVWTSDAELDLAEARRLTSRRGATVAMFLGETGVGKTTLLAELWTDLLLHGSLGDIRFGGSCTAMPFEQRAFYSRMESGVLVAYTPKTHEEDDGFLHLRVRRADGTVIELLLSDFAGEHFVRIREGTPLIDELPWASRVDRFAVVFDADAGTTPGAAEVAVTRAERLLHGLRVAGESLSSRQLALVVAKDDAVNEERRELLASAVERLQVLACQFDPGVTTIHVAARPVLGTAPYGLDTLLKWLSGGPAPPTPWPTEGVRSARAFGRFRP